MNTLGNALMRVVYAVGIAAVIYVMVYITGAPQWLAQIIVVSLAFLALNIWILWYGFSRKNKMINSDPEFDTHRRRHEIELRIVVIAFGLLMAYWMTVPLAVDLIGLIRGGNIIQRTNAVAMHEVGGTSDWFLYQSVEFSVNGKIEAYTFFLLPQRTMAGATYDLIALPRTHIILEYRATGGTGNNQQR